MATALADEWAPCFAARFPLRSRRLSSKMEITWRGVHGHDSEENPVLVIVYLRPVFLQSPVRSREREKTRGQSAEQSNWTRRIKCKSSPLLLSALEKARSRGHSDCLSSCIFHTEMAASEDNLEIISLTVQLLLKIPGHFIQISMSQLTDILGRNHCGSLTPSRFLSSSVRCQCYYLNEPLMAS
ncbi:hypothetical protein GJAV_G00021330 [Gymnothorax javanicus]|nr:hypothetical protein GJAV_G00021330 [Gymnothorax javanicus]